MATLLTSGYSGPGRIEAASATVDDKRFGLAAFGTTRTTMAAQTCSGCTLRRLHHPGECRAIRGVLPGDPACGGATCSIRSRAQARRHGGSPLGDCEEGVPSGHLVGDHGERVRDADGKMIFANYGLVTVGGQPLHFSSGSCHVDTCQARVRRLIRRYTDTTSEVDSRGLEPPTSCASSRRSSQLS